MTGVARGALVEHLASPLSWGIGLPEVACRGMFRLAGKERLADVKTGPFPGFGLRSRPTSQTTAGGMAEWSKATVLKTVVRRRADRGFESLSLRQRSPR